MDPGMGDLPGVVAPAAAEEAVLLVPAPAREVAAADPGMGHFPRRGSPSLAAGACAGSVVAPLHAALAYKFGSEKATALNTYAIMKYGGNTGLGARIDAGSGDLGSQGAPPPYYYRSDDLVIYC